MIVFDAATLILLAKAEILQLALKERKGLLTQEVWQEIQRGKGPDVKQFGYFKELGDLKVIEVQKKPAVKKIEEDFNLAKGEATSLCLAKEKNLPLATDDRLAIRAAKILGIPFLTAIHFLIGLKEKNNISLNQALTALEKLAHYGRYQEMILADARQKLKEV